MGFDRGTARYSPFPQFSPLVILVLDQKPWQFGPKWQGGGDITAYMARPHAPDGAPTVGETVGVARITRRVMLEGSVAT